MVLFVILTGHIECEVWNYVKRLWSSVIWAKVHESKIWVKNEAKKAILIIIEVVAIYDGLDVIDSIVDIVVVEPDSIGCPNSYRHYKYPWDRHNSVYYLSKEGAGATHINQFIYSFSENRSIK